MTMEQEQMSTQEFIAALLSPQREEELDPFMVMTYMPITPNDHVADIGCGPGYFSIPLAKHLIHGRLYAMDILDEMLEAVRRRVSETRLGNVEVMKCSPTEFPLPAGSLDGVMLAFVLHRSEDKVGMMVALRELLKPRGWCTVLDWYRKDTGGGPPLEIRIEPPEMEELARSAGFQLRGWRDLNGKQYMVTLSK